MMNNRPTPMRRAQRGMTMLIVLIMLSVMLLGGLALARMTSVGTMVAGNITFKERALQASEAGLNTAFAAITVAGFPENADIGGWYFASARALDAQGLPVGVNLDVAGQQLDVGVDGAGGLYNVRYVVERMCSNPPIVDILKQCLMRQVRPDPDCIQNPTNPDGGPCVPIDPPAGVQFRITARVAGPKGTRTVVQTMVTRGD